MIIHKKSSFTIFVALMAMCTGSMSIFGTTSTHGTAAAATVVVVDDTAAAADAVDASSLLRGHRRLDDEDEEDGTSSCLSITDTICASGDHQVLCGLFQKYDTIGTALSSSKGGNDWILFAPNDDAFSFSKTVKELLEETLTDADVQDVLEFHAASVEANTTISAASSCGKRIRMSNGDDSRTKCKNGNVYQTGTGNLLVNDDDDDDDDDGSAIGPQIIDPDDPIEACNGIIHVLDGVMLPKISSDVLAGSTDDDDDDDDDDDEIEYIMTQNGDYLDPDRCYGIVGTCTNSTGGGTQMNFNRPADLLGECPPNSMCSGNGNCECSPDYCAVAGNKCQKIPKPPITQYNQTVRVRKEWRTLSDNEIERIANAFSIMNTTDTLSGREKYGKHFWNAQDLVVFHVCAVVDPRCDQAHFGPNFMTFHRAYLLLIENSLRAVDPEILAMPYWAMQLDSENGIYNPNNPGATDKDKYIFTKKYFGQYFTSEEDNFVVTDGLFAYWSVPEWIFQANNVYNDPSLAGQFRYGPDSDMGRSSLNTTNPGINKVSTCIAKGLYLPAQPGTAIESENPKSVRCTEGGKDCQKSMYGCGCGSTDQVQNDDTYRPGYNAVGQGAREIPSYCSEECLKDSTECPLYARSDHYSCIKYVQRNPKDEIYSNRFASNTNEITFTQEDFDMCTNPRFVESWMEWQNCIEKRTDGVCEIRLDDEMTKWQWLVSSQTGMAPSVGNFSHFGEEAREDEILNQFNIVNEDIENSLKVLAGLKPDKTMLATNISEYIGLATVWGCANPMGYVDTMNGRIGINNLHAQGHIRIGLDMFDTGTSSMDMGAFHGHHAHVDMSNMLWMKRMGNEGKVRHYGYPTGGQTRENSRDWIATAGLAPYGTSGPFGTYDMTYCQDYSVSYRYNGTRPEVQDMEPNHYSYLEQGPWLHGTTLDEVITEHFPFFDLYADYDGGDKGYTHKDVIEHSFPDRTDYTYDTMTKNYPNLCTDSKDCPPLPGFD